MRKLTKFFKKKRFLPIKFFIVAIVLIVCFASTIGFFKGNVLPVVLTLSEATVKSLAVNAINNATHMVIDSNDSYNELVSTTKNSLGDIEFIQLNTVKINRLVRELANLCQANIEKIEANKVSLPIGAFTGSLVLSGIGPNVEIALLPIGSVTCDFLSTFEEVGINQTRHSIYVNINTTISLVLPVSSLPVHITTSILLCDNIIIGKVPNVYFNSQSSGKRLDLLPIK